MSATRRSRVQGTRRLVGRARAPGVATTHARRRRAGRRDARRTPRSRCGRPRDRPREVATRATKRRRSPSQAQDRERACRGSDHVRLHPTAGDGADGSAREGRTRRRPRSSRRRPSVPAPGIRSIRSGVRALQGRRARLTGTPSLATPSAAPCADELRDGAPVGQVEADDGVAAGELAGSELGAVGVTTTGGARRRAREARARAQRADPARRRPPDDGAQPRKEVDEFAPVVSQGWSGARRRGPGQMPTKKPARKPARRARRSAPNFHLPALEQRQLDLIGLGLVGLGLFFGFPSTSAGRRSRRLEAVEGLRWLLGAGHYLVPVGLLCAGAILMLRPVLPAVRPFRAGALCLFLAVTWPVGRDRGPGPASGPSWWTPSGSRPAAAWWGRRSTGASRRWSAASARTSWRSSCSSPACCC